MTFSENQVRQLYVATAVKSSVAATDTAGTIAVISDTAKTHLYFQYKGADNLMRSDLVDPKSILDAKATPASALAQVMKVKTVTLDTTVNSGNPVTGQDYVLRISFRQYLGMSDEEDIPCQGRKLDRENIPDVQCRGEEHHADDRGPRKGHLELVEEKYFH